MLRREGSSPSPRTISETNFIVFLRLNFPLPVDSQSFEAVFHFYLAIILTLWNKQPELSTASSESAGIGPISS